MPDQMHYILTLQHKDSAVISYPTNLNFVICTVRFLQYLAMHFRLQHSTNELSDISDISQCIIRLQYLTPVKMDIWIQFVDLRHYNKLIDQFLYPYKFSQMFWTVRHELTDAISHYLLLLCSYSNKSIGIIKECMQWHTSVSNIQLASAIISC